VPTGLPERGRAFVLKIETAPSVYTTIAGQRTTSLTINSEQVDVSSKEEEWRTLLTGAGVKSISLAASGVFKDSAAADLLRSNALDQLIDNYQIVFEDGDVWQGGFQIASLEFTGEYNGAREFSATFESSGTITFDKVT
jgi:TP901-1 family phage major tail protein